MSRFVVPALTSLALLCVAVSVNAGDLQQIQARKQIAAQKLKTDVARAIEDARKVSPESAKQLLERMRREVTDSLDLLPSEKTPLLSQLQTAVRSADEAARAKKVVDDQRPVRLPPITRPVDPPYPGGVSGFAKDWIAQPKNAAKLHADLIREREKGNLNLMLGIEKMPPMPNENGIGFPSNWKQLSEARKKLVSPQLTEREVKILKTLNSTMSVRYDGDKFKAVLQHLEEKTGLTLIVDPQSERDLNLDYDDPVTLKIERATVRTILKTALGQKGLTYIIKEGNIQVMTPKRAAEHTVIRPYQIDDLISPNPQMAMMYGPMFAPQMNRMQRMQNAQQLIQLIMMTTDPNYWQPNGPGSILFYEPTGTLLIRASTEMHYQMSSPGMFGR